MPTIQEITKKYSSKIDPLDFDFILSRVIKKPREFVLAHPEFRIPITHNSRLTTLIKRRIKGEPLAYILGEKEFYGLKFKVNKNVLVPRPETELLVELALNELKAKGLKLKAVVVDVGTGSGNIIISLAKELKKFKLPITNYQLLATDISKKALAVAKRNAKLHKVDKKIKFLQGNLLNPLIGKLSVVGGKWSVIIIANLPYLSRKNYDSAPASVKNYEPREALLSSKQGLHHYDKLLRQIKNAKECYSVLRVSCFMEISPEQKKGMRQLVRSLFPRAKMEFYKDLAGKFRACKIGF